MYGYSRARTAPVGGTRTPRTPVMLSRKGRLPRVITVPPDTGRPKILSGSEHSRSTCTGAPPRGQICVPHARQSCASGGHNLRLGLSSSRNRYAPDRFVRALSLTTLTPHRAQESKGSDMPKLIQPLDTGDPLGPLPQEFAAIMRPELPSLVMEIGVEVTRAYPEYARLLSGPNGQAIRIGVEQSLSAFVDLVAEPTSSTSLRDDMCRRFGRFEAYEGRTMEALQGAYRLGARVALRISARAWSSSSSSSRPITLSNRSQWWLPARVV